MVVGCIGVQRGGTTALAGVVKLLGYRMYPTNRALDDHELHKAIEHSEFEKVSKRGDEWAFKHTQIWQWHDRIEKCIPNIRYIFIFRDAVASAQHSNSHPSTDKIFHRYNQYAAFRTDRPALYVSYEKLVLETEETVRTIADFVEKDVTQEAVAFVNKSKGYQDIWIDGGGVV